MKVSLCITLVFAIGCDGIGYDLDRVPLTHTDNSHSGFDADGPDAPPPADMASDIGDTSAEPDTGDDMSVDAADIPDAGPDIDMPMSRCEIPQPLDPARCDPTRTGECPENGFCTFAVAGVPPPQLLCVRRDLEGEGDVETPCSAVSDCLEGLTCVDWGLQEADPRPKACTRYCELESGFGCASTEFCTKATSQPPADGIGYCTPSCDPYDPNACPTGQTCNVDYNYPNGTCHPQFRCVRVEDTRAEGEPCGPGRLVASCGEDLICYEVSNADFRCVAPCQSAAECGGSTCLPAQGPWELRFCAL